MDICVVGWYFYDEFYNYLESIKNKFNITVISHNGNSYLENYNIKFYTKENIGLEFGAYDFYLKNYWDRSSNVLFIHDDCSNVDFEKIQTKCLGLDQAYIFKDKQEERNNGGKHGRCIYTSSRLLNLILSYECICHQSIDKKDNHNPETTLKGCGPHNGFWYDKFNRGHVSGKPPKGVRHYNDGIYHFHWLMGRIRDQKCNNEKMNVVNRIYIDDIKLGRRGKFK